jgi:hypothetical protein
MVLRIDLRATELYPAIWLRNSGYAYGDRFYLSLRIAPAVIWNLVFPNIPRGMKSVVSSIMCKFP